MVALLWSANIGAILPIVEVLFRGKSLHQWVDERVEKSEVAMVAAETEIARLQQEITTAEADNAVKALETELHYQRDIVASEQSRLKRSRQLEPYIKKYTPATPYRSLVLIIGFLFAGTALRCLFLTGNMYLVARVGQRTMLDIQNVLFRKSMQMELGELGVKGTGDLVGRIRGETGAIAKAITTLFGKVLREPLKMFACIAGAAMVNWRLLLFCMTIVPVAAFFMFVIARMTKRANKRAMEESARLMNRLFQAVSFLRLVKAFNMQGHEQQRFSQVARDVYKKAMRISFFTALGRTNNELVGVGLISLSVLAGAFLTLNGETHLLNIRLSATPMTPSEMMLFFGFLVGIADPLRKMGDVYNMIQSGAVAAERVFPLYDREPRVVEHRHPQSLDRSNTSLTFDGVRFEYEPGQPVLEGVDFQVPAGSAVAIVGANGCGKSTLISLLMRFFDSDSGAIRLGAHDIREYRLEDLRETIGFVQPTDHVVQRHDCQQHSIWETRRHRSTSAGSSTQGARVGVYRESA